MEPVNTGGSSSPEGRIQLTRTRDLGDLRLLPTRGLFWRLKNLPNRLRGYPGDLAVALLGRIGGAVTLSAALSGVQYRRDMTLPAEIAQRLRALLDANVDPRTLVAHFGGTYTEYGVMSTRLVTDAGVAFIVDAMHAAATIANLKYHGFGTGTTNEAQGDTALVTELTTQYATNNTRITGSNTEASAAVYQTAATLTPDADVAITEHGVFDQAANSGGTLLDRSKFAAVNLVAAGGDSLAVTYNLTLTAGG